MGLRKPYFKDVLDIGNLDVEYVMFEETHPILFTCRDSKKQLYICVCFDIRGEQRWIVSKTTVRTIKALLSNEISIRKSMINEWDEYYIITYSCDGKKAVKVRLDEIDPLDLPTEGEYMESDENEFSDYIDKLETLE